MQNALLGVRILWICCYGLLAVFWWEQGWETVAVILLVGMGAMALSGIGWSWTASLQFLILLTGAGIGMAAGLNSWGMFALVSLALVTWDIDLLARRLLGFAEVDPRIWQRHARALGWVLGLAWGAGALALSLKFTFSFGWVLLLGILFLIVFLLFLRAPQTNKI